MDHARLLRLSPHDNVLIAASSVAAGQTLPIGDHLFPAFASIGLGHKIAARAIAHGEKIIKYGVPIGSATEPIKPGEHVHLHNMKSDYLPTYTLERERSYLPAS